MNILMLNYEFPPIGGGAANAHLRLLEQYAQKDGLHVDVLTSGPKSGFVTDKFSDNIMIYKVGIHKKHLPNGLAQLPHCISVAVYSFTARFGCPRP